MADPIYEHTLTPKLVVDPTDWVRGLNAVDESIKWQANLFALAGHTHTESEITDLDKFTQAEVVQLVTDGLALKEDLLGNPTSDGDILSSTVAGARSWIPFSSGNDVVVTVDQATYPIAVTDDIVHVTYTATGAVIVEIQSVGNISGRSILVKDAAGNASVNNITIATEGAETIDGSGIKMLTTNYEAVVLYCDGTNWFIY